MEESCWHRVTFYDWVAEIADEYVKKDNPIYVDGRFRYCKYTGSGGGRKGSSGQKGAGEEGRSGGRRLPAPSAYGVSTAASAKKPPATTNDIDEDIRF